MVILESVGQEVYEDQQDLKDLLESQDHQVEEECLAPMVPQDPKVNQEIEVWWAPLDLRENMETWEGLDHLDCRDSEDHLAGEDQEEQWDHQGRVESLDKMVRTESQVHRVCRVFQDLWEPPETRVQWASRASRVIPECLDLKDLEVIQAKMAYLATVDLLVRQVLLVTEVLLEVLDQEAFKACLVPLGKMEWQDVMVSLDFRDHQE